VRRRLALVALSVGALAFLTPAVIALASPPVVAQASASLGLTVPELIVGLTAILGAVAGPLVGAIVKISSSKDEAHRAHVADKQAQADAHRAERKELFDMLERERDRNERQATAFAGTLGEVSKTAMEVVDGFRREVAGAYVTPDTPDTPPSRASRPMPPPSASGGARGRRNSNG
jgi:hypothetical protein